MASFRRLLIIVIITAIAGLAGTIQAQEPVLIDLELTPATVNAGEVLQVAVQVTNASSVDWINIVNSEGGYTSFGDPAFLQTGDTFTGELPIPSNTINGAYAIRAIGVVGDDGLDYRFWNSAFFPEPACPTWTNIGILVCTSDLVRDEGMFEVVGGLESPMPPDLLSVSLSPSFGMPGTSIDLTIEVTNTEEIAAIFLVRPAGTHGELPMDPVVKNGDLFTTSIQLPMNTATGTWKISELVIRNAADETYGWLNSSTFPGHPPCPNFELNGRWMCGSDLLRDFGSFDVGGANLPLPEPEVLSISYEPNIVDEGDSTVLTIEVANAEEIEALFLVRSDLIWDWLPYEMPFQRSGDFFSTAISIPVGTWNGVYWIWEFGIRNGIDEVYRFLNAGIFSGESPCPNFFNGGVFMCASEIVRDQGPFTVGQAANSTPTANAGPDQNVIAGETCEASVILNGSASHDPDNDPLSFEWSSDFGIATESIVNYLLPVGTHTFTLTVDDGQGGQDSDEVVVMVDPNDPDGDGICGTADNCPNSSNPLQENADGDEYGDVCDLCPSDSDNDIDNDGFCGNVDNCPLVSNSDQADHDFDGIGNLCDPVFDADGPAGHVKDVASAATDILESIYLPGANGLIAKLLGVGGVVRRVYEAVSDFDAGLIDQTAFLEALNGALGILGDFDSQLTEKIANGQVVEPEASQLLAASADIRATIEILIAYAGS